MSVAVRLLRWCDDQRDANFCIEKVVDRVYRVVTSSGAYPMVFVGGSWIISHDVQDVDFVDNLDDLRIKPLDPETPLGISHLTHKGVCVYLENQLRKAAQQNGYDLDQIQQELDCTAVGDDEDIVAAKEHLRGVEILSKCVAKQRFVYSDVRSFGDIVAIVDNTPIDGHCVVGPKLEMDLTEFHRTILIHPKGEVLLVLRSLSYGVEVQLTAQDRMAGGRAWSYTRNGAGEVHQFR